MRNSTVRFGFAVSLLMILALLLIGYAVSAEPPSASTEDIVEQDMGRALWENLPQIVGIFFIVASILIIIIAGLITKYHRDREPREY